MIKACLALCAAGVLHAQDTIESLRAEVTALRAAIAAQQLKASYDLRVCAQPDMMQANLDAANTQRAAAELKAEAAKPKPETPVQKLCKDTECISVPASKPQPEEPKKP